MIEREITHRLWVSSRFTWVLKCALVLIYLSWIAWAVYWMKGPSHPPQWMRFSWIYILLSFFWAWPFVLHFALHFRCSSVWWEGGILVRKRLGDGQDVFLVNEDTKLRRLAKFKGWHEPGDLDDAAQGGLGVITLIYGVFSVLAMLLPLWQRDFFELRTSKFSRGGASVLFYHPRRKLGSGRPFQQGMQLLLMELGEYREERDVERVRFKLSSED